MDSPYAQALSIECVHPTLEVDEARLDSVLRHVIDAEGGSLVHLSLVLSGHDPVRALNEQYLGHAYNTDVLAFSLQDGTPDDETVEGEVYVDLDTAADRYEEFDASFQREVYRYAIHGVLHLLGYSDKTESGQEQMRALEDRYLNEAQVD